MNNNKISNLLRAVADLMDQSTELAVETQKEITKNTEKFQNDFYEHSLKLMKRIEENDTVRSYKHKLERTNKNLSDALKEIQKLREKALEDMVKESMLNAYPLDFYQAWDRANDNLKKMGEHVVEEVKTMTDAITK